MATEVLNVKGMSCNHCVETITNAVSSLQGIDKVSVHLEEKKVTVDYDPAQTDVSTVSSKIKEVGFDVA